MMIIFSNKNSIKIFFIGLLILIINASLFCQTIEEEFSQICIDNGLIGSSLVTICGEDIQVYNFGQSHINPSIEVNNDTKYRIASISKLVTAIGVLMLVDDGLIDLDEDVSTYLGWELKNPNFPNMIITPRLLLSHQSTITDGTG